MRFIQIKGKYINLDNVFAIKKYDHPNCRECGIQFDGSGFSGESVDFGEDRETLEKAFYVLTTQLNAVNIPSSPTPVFKGNPDE